jgi:hypothetical protein
MVNAHGMILVVLPFGLGILKEVMVMWPVTLLGLEVPGAHERIAKGMETEYLTIKSCSIHAARNNIML